MKKHLRSLLVAGVCGALVVAGVVANAVSAADTELRIIVPDADNLQFMSFWVAQGAGYFAAEKINLQLLVPDEPNQAQSLVLQEKADCAVLPPPMYLELIAQDFPWVLVANLLENDAINLIVRRSVFEQRKLSATAPLKERLAGPACGWAWRRIRRHDCARYSRHKAWTPIA